MARDGAPGRLHSPNGRPPDHRPHSLAEALRAAGVPLDGSSQTGSETPSEEDYDETVRPALAPNQQLRRRKPHTEQRQDAGRPLDGLVRDEASAHIVYDNDQSIQDLLRRSSMRFKDPGKKFYKFGDLVFTRQVSVFDPHSIAAANSPFYGFYTLFWLAVALFVVKISADNWRQYGSPLGPKDIMTTMFHRDGKQPYLLPFAP